MVVSYLTCARPPFCQCTCPRHTPVAFNRSLIRKVCFLELDFLRKAQGQLNKKVGEQNVTMSI